PIAGGPCGSPPFLRKAYAVLAPLSRRYPPLRDTFRCITHPFAARRQGCPRAAARLACVKHAASVQSEPGSNSSVRSLLQSPNSLDSRRPTPLDGTWNSTRSTAHLRKPPTALASCEHSSFGISPSTPNTRCTASRASSAKGSRPSTHTYRLQIVKEHAAVEPFARQTVLRQQRGAIVAPNV